MKTIADMTPEQRAECVGMWCYIFDCESELPVAEGIIAGYRETDNGQTQAVVVYPGQDSEKWRYTLNEVSPCFNLPRAWNPDGTPLQATRETITGYEGMRLDAPGGDSFLTTPGTIYQRWIADWEESDNGTPPHRAKARMRYEGPERTSLTGRRGWSTFGPIPLEPFSPRDSRILTETILATVNRLEKGTHQSNQRREKEAEQ